MKSTLEEQQAFVTVVDSGSITSAAERLGISVSGVSRALNRLEQKLGATLLRRTTRRLELTEEGETLLEHCRRILAAVEEAEEAMLDRHNQPQGRLRINAAPSFMQFVIVPLIGEFRASYPGITLELDTHDRFVDLLEQRVDLAIRIGELEDSSLHARLLGYSPLRLLASPAYLERAGVPQSIEDLQAHSLLGFSQLDHLNQWPLILADGKRLHITPTLSASSGSTLIELAIAGEGVVCLADFMTIAPRQNGVLVDVLPDCTTLQTQAVNAVYYRQATLSQRTRLFMEFLAERLPGKYLSA
ncbi:MULTISPECIES: LysR substrate-binding domain-containing protein [Halomonadaceae]|uniref:LysR family transcriptional regulator n=2 Tax=Vreelandella TaxID=3137766 RepID=A0A7Z0S018_9GAMM|nr:MULTISPECIES: LysR substrate-binding domain-containing protein [Halomonas]AJY51918.1 transcriptional regulator, LysR family [Halomonas sp. KO116]NYS79922.1 LysR family transcriptional regulator [Halomonas glaciei]|tara:strand:+ start:3765 stop:4667 length:903 start_codon:yes stop_codon:yes gene_type:complete